MRLRTFCNVNFTVSMTTYFNLNLADCLFFIPSWYLYFVGNTNVWRNEYQSVLINFWGKCKVCCLQNTTASSYPRQSANITHNALWLWICKLAYTFWICIENRFCLLKSFFHPYVHLAHEVFLLSKLFWTETYQHRIKNSPNTEQFYKFHIWIFFY